MKSKAFVLVALFLLVSSVFAKELASDQHVETKQGDEPKQINQGGGGYCRNRWCCGGWDRGRCRRYCCRSGANAAENEVEPAAVDNGNFGTYGGGGGHGGGCKYGQCCSGKGKGGGGCRCCVSAEEANAFIQNNQAQAETKN